MRELNDQNELDVAAKTKIADYSRNSYQVDITRTAERDAALLSITKTGLLEAMQCHIQAGKVVFFDRLDSGEGAYVFSECEFDSGPLYIKVKFYLRQGAERMLILSAHPHRRWS